MMDRTINVAIIGRILDTNVGGGFGLDSKKEARVRKGVAQRTMRRAVRAIWFSLEGVCRCWNSGGGGRKVGDG